MVLKGVESEDTCGIHRPWATVWSEIVEPSGGRGDWHLAVLGGHPKSFSGEERSLSLNQYSAPNQEGDRAKTWAQSPGPHEGKSCGPGTWTLPDVRIKRRAEGEDWAGEGPAGAGGEPLTSPRPLLAP